MNPKFIPIGKVIELKKKGLLTAKLIGKPIAVLHDDTEEIWAIEMSCKHQGADLTKGKINNFQVTCPRHGWIYNLKTGECDKEHSPKLRQHDVQIAEDMVRVSMTPKNSLPNF